MEKKIDFEKAINDVLYRDSEIVVNVLQQMYEGLAGNVNLSNLFRWRRLEDELPPLNKRVIGYFPAKNEGGEFVATAYYDGEKLRSDLPNSTAAWFCATQWMPLPEPPRYGRKRFQMNL